MAKEMAGGTVHPLPADLKKALLAKPKALAAWQDITPLARNEWICWTVTVKQAKTRQEHVRRATEELAGGKRRPCCWMGCIHRKDKAMSAAQKWVLSKKTKN
jgi:uncharacterized protein YdeI (YjbR/CyaY-like superfamily)